MSRDVNATTVFIVWVQMVPGRLETSVMRDYCVHGLPLLFTQSDKPLATLPSRNLPSLYCFPLRHSLHQRHCIPPPCLSICVYPSSSLSISLIKRNLLPPVPSLNAVSTFTAGSFSLPPRAVRTSSDWCIFLHIRSSHPPRPTHSLAPPHRCCSFLQASPLSQWRAASSSPFSSVLTFPAAHS